MTTADQPDTGPDTPPLPDVLARAVRAAGDKKATDLVALDLRPVDAFTDWFLICSGRTGRHAKAIADGVEESLRAIGVRPAHIEGDDRADWILLDYFDFVVHVFQPETRAFYGLERLWGSAKKVDVAPLLAPDRAAPRLDPPPPAAGDR
jgi:ribosome-associated protein